MQIKNSQLTLDANEERDPYLEGTSTIIVGSALPSEGIFAVPTWPGAFVHGTTPVNSEGSVLVFTNPTLQWLTIYPTIQPEPSLDILEDFDIPLKPKRTKRVKGIVVRRSRARFQTAFADDLVYEMETNK